MKVLVTGGNGTMGKALREFLPDALYLSRQECDVTNDRQLNEVFQREQPDVVIHAAAITDHQHPNASEIIQTNIIGTELVSRYCRAFNAKIVYLSTHYVYPGETGNYKETDETRPIGTYAWSKLAGEGWAQIVPEWLIVRGSWYTPEKLDMWEGLGAYADAWCNRTTPVAAAAAITQLVRHDATGVYNIGGARRTFYEILLAERRPVTLENGAILRPRARVRGYEPSAPYRFPFDSSVNTDKFASLGGR